MKPERKLVSYLLLAIVWMSMAAIWPRPSRVSGNSLAAAKQVYTGNIFYFGGRQGSSVTTFTLTIDSFNSDAEIQSLADTLKNGGQDALLKAITKEKRGTIRIDTGLARDINAAWMSEGPEGERKITALSERLVGFSEARRGARSLDYPFTFIEIYMETDGKGEGGLIPAAKVQFKGGKNWEVENFGIYPARLTNIRLRTK
jgi:hypothetical protein